MANQLIPSHLREGRVLDIGCGSLPYFLLNTVFAEKFGLDKVVYEQLRTKLRQEYDIDVVDFDLEENTRLPFDDRSFDVVVMLAVFEHIEPPRLSGLISEIGRVLKNDGIYIITTPAPWTDVLLKVMAKSGLVSAVEIGEHKAAYTRKKIGYGRKAKERAEALAKLLLWTVNEGQKYVEPLHYAPLSKEAQVKANKLVRSITFNSAPLLK